MYNGTPKISQNVQKVEKLTSIRGVDNFEDFFKLAFDIRSQVEFFVHQTGDDHSLEKAQILR
jgi:hypothetical protein